MKGKSAQIWEKLLIELGAADEHRSVGRRGRRLIGTRGSLPGPIMRRGVRSR